MAKLKDFDNSKINEYTVDEINEFINEIELTRSVIREKLTAEMAEKVKDDRFDAFSFWGQRALKKIAKKYDGALAGADVYMAIMKTELARREALSNTSSYTGKSIVKQKEVSEEEFLQKEQDKTWSYRSKIE